MICLLKHCKVTHFFNTSNYFLQFFLTFYCNFLQVAISQSVTDYK